MGSVYSPRVRFLPKTPSYGATVSWERERVSELMLITQPMEMALAEVPASVSRAPWMLQSVAQSAPRAIKTMV